MTTNPMNQCQTPPSSRRAHVTGLPIAEMQSDNLPDPTILTPEERTKEFARIMLRAIQRRRVRNAQ